VTLLNIISLPCVLCYASLHLLVMWVIIYLSTSVLVWQGVSAVSTTAVSSTKSPTATSPTQVHASVIG
jgi:hypothetical protein